MLIFKWKGNMISNVKGNADPIQSEYPAFPFASAIEFRLVYCHYYPFSLMLLFSI